MSEIRFHELKCWPEPFQAMADGLKPFEYRRNDRAFMVGDTLFLREYEPYEGRDIESNGFTGRALYARVSYVLQGVFGVPEGFAVLGLDREIQREGFET